MSDATQKRASTSSEGDLIGTTADALGSVTRLALKASMLPALSLQYLPDSAPFDSVRSAVRASAAFPRAVAKAITDVADEVAGIEGDGDVVIEAGPPKVQIHRRRKTDTAVIFIHGFGQTSQGTWGEFPRYVAGLPKLDDWDIYSVGYSTNLWIDVAGLWSASPPITQLSLYLKTLIDLPPFDGYKSLAIVAHSMGGLVVQNALVENEALRARVGHFICFGTPSGGLIKAALLSGWKRQVRDMAAGGPFVTRLRRQWKERIGDAPSFRFMVVAGDTDEFVPALSTIEPFPVSARAVTPGNHMTLVQPKSAADPNVQLLQKLLAGEAAPAGPWNSARVAVEGRNFRRAIDDLWPARAKLDEPTRVVLALALDSVGRREDSIKVLEDSPQPTTDAMGSLAGRLKRRWLQERQLEDGRRAQDLYGRALAIAEERQDASQSFYHAINVAFLDLALDHDRRRARQNAKRALDHCEKAFRDVWCLATEGEANLVLGEDDKSIEAYRQALALDPKPWQVSSMFHQAVAVADLTDNKKMADRLRELFRGEV